MKKFTLFIAMLCVIFATMAIPARRATKTVKQSDGTTLVIQLVGDESFHYYRTTDGIPLVREANGDYSYAILNKEGCFESTRIIAHNAADRLPEEASKVSAIRDAGLDAGISKIAATRAQRYDAPRRKARTIEPFGVINIPVILVQFSDYEFTYEQGDVVDLFNAENYTGPANPFTDSTPGSLREYYIAQSDGAFTPNFVVSSIVTLDNPMSYYGGNNYKDEDKNPQQMIIDACLKLADEMDFSIFDNDGDGEVEFLYCLYAGYSEAAGADEETIWPHQWYLSSQKGAIYVDGVKIDCYACSSELSLNADYADYYGVNLTGIGSCCHEFSHCLGLPDFYDTKNTNPAFGMDYWDLMDYGCYNAEGYVPVGYSAYERDFMGWRKLPVLETKGDYTLEAITSGGHGYKIMNENNYNEYYILENRQQEGWDKYIFNTGLLITHVDYEPSAWRYNTVNVDKTHQRYTIIPADGKTTTYYESASSAEYRKGLQGDIWPGITNNTELTDESTPAATVFRGGYMGKPITNIKNENGIVSFSFMKNAPDTPANVQITDVTDEGFTVLWDAVEDAKKYYVELYKLTEGVGTTETIDGKEYVVEEVSTATTVATKYVFSGLEGSTMYRIRVSAVDGEKSSEPSEYVYVTLLQTGIDAIVSGGSLSDVQLFDLQGRSVKNPTKGIYVVRSGGVSKKVLVE